MNDAVRQLQGRLQLLRSTFLDRDWPDVSDAELCDSLEEWLEPHLGGVNSTKRAAQLDIAAILRQHLDYRQQQELDELAPTHISVPSGSRIRIDYSGETPVLAVKLQELFGLAVGPTVCSGRIPVLLHLLSPAGRPIQVTRDLKGFWDGAYQQVKKELKGRYPKHPWPDDPWSAAPTRRLKPRR
jgi:ATP-dependent helicase HrpB